MAGNKRISELDLITEVADNDLLIVVDISEPDITKKTKKITFGELQELIETEVVQQTIDDLAPALGEKAPLASPALTGSPTSPTPAVGDDSTSIANTSFVKTAVATLEAITISLTEKGAANGVCPLGPDSLVSSTYLPSYVDDVLEFADLASFPATGSTGKIYLAIDTLRTYRWSGSVYVLIPAGGVDSVNTKTGVVVLNTDDIAEGVGTNKYYTAAKFDTALATKTTADLSEGANLYYTALRAKTDALVDFDFGTPTQDDFLVYNSGTSKWEKKTKAQVKTLLMIDVPSVVIPSTTIDWSLGKYFYKSISANETYALSNEEDGRDMSAIITNTSGSDITVSFTSAKTFLKAVGALTVKANSSSVFTFISHNNKLALASVNELV